MALLDVPKAFDSVNHEMLCEKIRLAGIEPDWFISYLEARKHMVCAGESYSSSETIKCGVPQGSVLGPWCYLMHSNDIASSVSCKLLMYADDTVLLVSDKNINTVSVQLGNEVKCHTHNVGASNQVKYLGLVMDTNLSSQVTAHVHCQKGSRKVEIYVQASKLVG